MPQTPESLHVTQRSVTSVSIATTPEQVNSDQSPRDHSPSCLISVSDEISSLLQHNALLEAALADQKDLNQLKAQFVSTVAHELRSPMTIIRTTTELLKQRGDNITPEVQQAYLVGINASLERMGRIIDDLLLVGEADSGKLQFSPAPVNLHQFCRDVIVELMPSLASASDRICQDRIDLCYQGSPVAKLDARFLRYILSNLLSNALKYSAANQPVQLDLICETDRQMLTCRIHDRGIGIPEADQTHLI